MPTIPSKLKPRTRRGFVFRVILTVAALVITLVAVILFMLQRITPRIPLGTPNHEIAFVSNRDSNWDIFTMDSDGSLDNLTATSDEGRTANDWFVAWAMDGEALFFLSDRTGESGPAIMKPDGSDQRPLTILSAITTLVGEGRVDWDPTISPDGQHIAWSSLRDLNLEVYVMDADGDNRQRLTNHFPFDWYPAWSPDGTRIAFSSERDGNLNVYLMNADGSDQRALTTDKADELRAMWSLDGKQIAFVSERDHSITTGALDIWVVDADGEPNPRPLPSDTVFEGGMRWSPDGSQVLYVSNREGDWNIYVMDANGDNVRRLTDSDADDLFPVWRP
jgi:Tol biopolymer transport system component